jgi:hypothetical protein
MAGADVGAAVSGSNSPSSADAGDSDQQPTGRMYLSSLAVEDLREYDALLLAVVLLLLGLLVSARCSRVLAGLHDARVVTARSAAATASSAGGGAVVGGSRPDARRRQKKNKNGTKRKEEADSSADEEADDLAAEEQAFLNDV